MQSVTAFEMQLRRKCCSELYLMIKISYICVIKMKMIMMSYMETLSAIFCTLRRGRGGGERERDVLALSEKGDGGRRGSFSVLITCQVASNSVHYLLGC